MAQQKRGLGRVKSLGHNLLRVVPGCLLGVAENLVGIATLGYYVPGWQLRWITYGIYRESQKEMRDLFDQGKERKKT